MTKEFHQTVWDDRLRDAVLRCCVRHYQRIWAPSATVRRKPWWARARRDAPTCGERPRESWPDCRQCKMLSVAGRFPRAMVDQDSRTAGGSRRDRGRHDRRPGPGLLAAERILLNFLGRLSGIATLTRQYVDAVAGTKARIYDTRKTTPGWRRLEKYAVRCGGGWNHRGGLDEAVLIKDNHLAIGADRPTGRRHSRRPKPFCGPESSSASTGGGAAM